MAGNSWSCRSPVPRVSAAIGTGWMSSFLIKDEVAFPGYYRVNLPEQGLQAELTATRHVGVHRYTFTGQGAPSFDQRHQRPRPRHVQRGEVRVLPRVGEVEGSCRVFGTFSKRYGGLTVYFVARSQPALREFSHLAAEYVFDRGQSDRHDVGVDLVFPKTDARPPSS